LFLEHRGENIPKRPKDFMVIVTLHESGKTIKVGVGSGGDHPDLIDRNFKFFTEEHCDVIVCASKRPKTKLRTYEVVKKWETDLNAEYIMIPTTVESNDPTLQKADNERVAKEIWESIF
jgi:hypothetical protein